MDILYDWIQKAPSLSTDQVNEEARGENGKLKEEFKAEEEIGKRYGQHEAEGDS